MSLDPEKKQKLIETAIQAMQWAYAPYSNYKVGASLLTASGKVYDGVNVENAAYPDCMCAERVAMFKAVSEGEKEFEAMAIATVNGGKPCGSCRQVMAEFNLSMIVLIVDESGKLYLESTVAQLLPEAFTPKDLI
jgi:cytidine deaminase